MTTEAIGAGANVAVESRNENPAIASEGDVFELLQKYKGLMDAGIITEEEFTAKKRQLMGI